MDIMDKDNIIKVLKIILIIALISFAFTLTKYKTNDCQLCKFEFEGETLRIQDFIELYTDRCFTLKPLPNFMFDKGGVINE